VLVERRRAAFSSGLLIRVLVAWIAIGIWLTLSRWVTGTIGEFTEPDDILRLMQVRDLIGGQNWFDLHQYRVDAPGGGVPMHWSRLVDLPIALVILLLSPILGIAGAETAAAFIVPMITLGFVVLLTMRIAWRLMGEEETAMTALVLAFSMPVMFQLLPTRIDHHGWQIVCALAAINGLMARSPIVGGRVIGIALTAWLAISIEGLPLAAIVFLVLALRWLRNRRDRAIVVQAIQTLAIASIVLFVATRGLSDFATYCDAISPVHLAMFGCGALALTALSRMEPIPTAWVLAGFAATGASAAGMLLWTAPQCVTSGGFDGLDPLVARYWHANILEGRPIWEHNLDRVLQYGVTPLLGLYAAFTLFCRSCDWLRAFWRDYFLILLGAFAISVFVLRAGSVACALAVPPVAWQLRQWLRAVRAMRGPLPRVAATVSILLVLVPTLPLVLLAKASPAGAFSTATQESPEAVSRCRFDEAMSILNRKEPGEIFAPLDIAPRLLFSHHNVLATSHHRANEAIGTMIATSLAPVPEARRILAERGTRYVVLCPRLAEIDIYRADAPDGFVAQLAQGREIDWLEPIGVETGNSLMLWRVRAD